MPGIWPGEVVELISGSIEFVAPCYRKAKKSKRLGGQCRGASL